MAERLSVGSALAIVVGQPSLWLIGALGFALRGGLLLLVAAIVVLPTPIELRMLLGDNLGSAGLTDSFVGLLMGAGVLAGLAVLAALALVGYCELAAFERLVRDPEAAAQLGGRQPVAPAPGQRRWLLVGLFTVQLGALIGLVVAALPLLYGIAELAYQEIVRPSLGGTIYVRVLNGVREPLLILLGGLVLVELISAGATRRLLTRGFGLSGAGAPSGPLSTARAVVEALLNGAGRPLLRPVSTLTTVVLAWGATLAMALPASWALGTAWSAVRDTYLALGLSSDVQSLVSAALVTIALAAIWVVAVLLGGFVSGLRNALWGLHGLR